MAEASSSEKEPLTSTFMYLDRVRSELLLKFNTLYWELEYKELGKGSIYFSYDPSLGYVFFSKIKESVAIILYTSCRRPIECFVVYQLEEDNRMNSDLVLAVEMEKEMYKIELPATLIHVPRNKYLKKRGSIVLGIRYNSRRLLNTEVGIYLEERDKTDNFLKAYEKQLFTDFVIRASGKEFRVHKAILSARSLYFLKNMHSTENEIVLDATATAVQNVIHYLYSGKLPTITLDAMIEVFEISVKLSIQSLMDQCTLYFLDILRPNNVEKIRDAALRTSNRLLIKATNSMCSRTE